MITILMKNKRQIDILDMDELVEYKEDFINNFSIDLENEVSYVYTNCDFSHIDMEAEISQVMVLNDLIDKHVGVILKDLISLYEDFYELLLLVNHCKKIQIKED